MGSELPAGCQYRGIVNISARHILYTSIDFTLMQGARRRTGVSTKFNGILLQAAGWRIARG